MDRQDRFTGGWKETEGQLDKKTGRQDWGTAIHTDRSTNVQTERQ